MPPPSKLSIAVWFIEVLSRYDYVRSLPRIRNFRPEDMASPLPDIIKTEIAYFSRNSKYETEKPYTTSFPVNKIPEASVDNHEWAFHRADVTDARTKLIPSLDIHGFQFISWNTSLSREDFDADEIIVSKYYTELANLVKQHFPHYKRIAIFDHAIRSRDSRYPGAKGLPTNVPQPFRFAHTDYTEHGAVLKLRDALGEGANERLKDRCDILNIWRPLNEEPTRDWPLTICDWRTIDPATDLISNDIVYERGLGENCFLRHNDAHRWWYLSAQKRNEVVIFRNVCIRDPSAARGFHCAFHNPFASEIDIRRESVEVRLAAFY